LNRRALYPFCSRNSLIKIRSSLLKGMLTLQDNVCTLNETQWKYYK
jgi:hypothetical protein